MESKLQIDVLGPIESSQYMLCKLYVDGAATRILMHETDYDRLVREGFFVRDGRTKDSAGVLNTSRVYISSTDSND